MGNNIASPPSTIGSQKSIDIFMRKKKNLKRIYLRPAIQLAMVFCFGCLKLFSAQANAADGEKFSSSTRRTRPNVLYILTDDQRFDAIGIAGNRHLKTPHIDRIGREGVFFKNAFCTTSLCSPSRASILSGLYAHAHGVTNNFTDYPSKFQSFPMVLKREGYQTAYIGKWHMGEENDDPRPGFDWFVTHKGQGKYFDTEFHINGQKREIIKGYYTTVVTDMAEKWIENRQSDAPWMLMLGHKAPHSFYEPEPKYAKAFADVQVTYPETVFLLDDKPAWMKQRLPTWHGLYGPLFEWRKKFPDSSPEAVKDFEAMMRAYWGTLLSVDDSVGRLLALLERRGELNNTLIVFSGDNGLHAGENGMVDKRTMHDASTRIPLLVRYPGLVSPEQPKVIDRQVLTIDIAPSILELCHAEKLEAIHGKSFVTLVRKDDPQWRTSWFYHYNYEKQFPYTPNLRGVRTDSWKYVHAPHGDGSPDRHLAELYNIEFDPDERHNLISNPKYADVVEKLKQELVKLMAQTNLTPLTDHMPIDEGINAALPDKKIR